MSLYEPPQEPMDNNEYQANLLNLMIAMGSGRDYVKGLGLSSPMSFELVIQRKRNPSLLQQIIYNTIPGR